MIRRLIAAMILLAVAAILVSPLADLDDAVHHHQHHHHAGLAANAVQSATTSLPSEYEPKAVRATVAIAVAGTNAAMRC